jgi:hypothetical protein
VKSRHYCSSRPDCQRRRRSSISSFVTWLAKQASGVGSVIRWRVASSTLKATFETRSSASVESETVKVLSIKLTPRASSSAIRSSTEPLIKMSSTLCTESCSSEVWSICTLKDRLLAASTRPRGSLCDTSTRARSDSSRSVIWSKICRRELGCQSRKGPPTSAAVAILRLDIAKVVIGKVARTSAGGSPALRSVRQLRDSSPRTYYLTHC